jgi:AraC-like DNA-binding protein
MIVRLKDMIERCIRRARCDECATCENQTACAIAKWQKGFAFAGPPPAREPSTRGGGFAPILAFLGEVTKAFEGSSSPPPGRFRREVEGKIAEMMTEGAGIDGIARALGLSRQTLYRRLKAEGVTYEALLDDLRRRLALRYVGRDGMSAKEAAWRLGFSDPAAFSRAFKRWTGLSPTDYRTRR